MGVVFDVDNDSIMTESQMEAKTLEEKLVKGKSYAGLTKVWFVRHNFAHYFLN